MAGAVERAESLRVLVDNGLVTRLGDRLGCSRAAHAEIRRARADLVRTRMVTEQRAGTNTARPFASAPQPYGDVGERGTSPCGRSHNATNG